MRLERRKNEPSIDVVLKMSKFFGVSIEDLLTKDIEKEGGSSSPLPKTDASLTRLNELLEARVKVLERELKKKDPGLADELGIK